MNTKLTRQIALLGIVVVGGIALASGSAAASGYDVFGQDRHPVSVSAPDSVTTGDTIELELKSLYAEVKVHGEIETADGYKEVKTGTTVDKYEEIHIDTNGVGDADGQAEFYIIAGGDEQHVQVDLEAPESGSDLPPWAQGLPAWFIDFLKSWGYL